jgi:hypothetical protein
VVLRPSSPTMAARHRLLQRRRLRTRPQPHPTSTAAEWGPPTAAQASGAAHGAQPCWGSPPSTTDSRPSAGGRRRKPAHTGRRRDTEPKEERGGTTEEQQRDMDLHLWRSSRPVFTGNSTSQWRCYSTNQRRRRLPGRQEEGIRVGHPPLLLYMRTGQGGLNWAGPKIPHGTRRPHRPTRPAINYRPPVTSVPRSSLDPPQLSKSPKNPPELKFSPQAFILYIFRLISAVYLCFRP